MQYQTPNDAGPGGRAEASDLVRTAPAGSVLMSSAWVRLAGALAMVGVLWMAVAWALAGVGG